MTQKENTGLLILRITFGILLLLHGIHKILNGIAGIKDALAGYGIPEIFGYGVYFGEVVGPLLVIVGFRTRIGALLMTINMLVAILLMHAGEILSINDHGAWAVETPALYLFGALALVFTGGGKYAVSGSNRWD